jgi:hypothetical protein
MERWLESSLRRQDAMTSTDFDVLTAFTKVSSQSTAFRSKVLDYVSLYNVI